MLLTYFRIIDFGILNNLFYQWMSVFFLTIKCLKHYKIYNDDIYYHKTPINFLSLGLTKFLLTKAVDSQKSGKTILTRFFNLS